MIEALGRIIERSLKRLNLGSRLREGQLILDFEKLLDRDLAGEVFFDRLEKGTLHLRVRSPAGMNEVKLRQKALLRKVNEFLGEKAVAELKISLWSDSPG